MTNEIKTLRSRIRKVDTEILKLAKRRLGLARLIGEAKATAGLPVRDFKVESDVLSAVRVFCEKERVAPELGEELMRTLIKGSVEVQENIHGRQFEGKLKTVLVIGGRGAMGKWFADFFSAQGHNVFVADVKKGADSEFPFVKDVAAFAHKAEVIVIATPIRSVDNTLRILAKTGTRALIFDIASIKSPFIKTLRGLARRGLRVGSIHPMFGPDARLLSGRTLILCNVGRAEDQKELRGLFAGTALSLVRMDIAQHDPWMAHILGLSHAVNIVFFDALASSGKRYAKLNEFESTTFQRQAASSRQVACENAELYFDIQNLNPRSAKVFKSLERSVARLKRAVKKGDHDSFVAIMKRGQTFFGSEPRETAKRRTPKSAASGRR